MKIFVCAFLYTTDTIFLFFAFVLPPFYKLYGKSFVEFSLITKSFYSCAFGTECPRIFPVLLLEPEKKRESAHLLCGVRQCNASILWMGFIDSNGVRGVRQVGVVGNSKKETSHMENKAYMQHENTMTQCHSLYVV